MQDLGHPGGFPGRGSMGSRHMRNRLSGACAPGRRVPRFPRSMASTLHTAVKDLPATAPGRATRRILIVHDQAPVRRASGT